jgi:hypothetical protein
MIDHGPEPLLSGQRPAQPGFLDPPVAVLAPVDQDHWNPVAVLGSARKIGIHVELGVPESQLLG